MKLQHIGKCTCGKKIYATTTKHEAPAVAHDVPYCKQVRDLSALEFITYICRARGIPEHLLYASRTQ